MEEILSGTKEYEFPRRDLYMETCAKKYIEAFKKVLDSSRLIY